MPYRVDSEIASVLQFEPVDVLLDGLSVQELLFAPVSCSLQLVSVDVEKPEPHC